ncbi:BLUF domain-containing protein [Bradyrhizobium sp. STM 3809]|uniref:BLUF domain-containing protein n=1 Tax=Bradyrhizobium sp. STM 3809 TaxID=551936 RepID=UPI00024099A3|nr:BLUF domain-containing protein [Bradyrhizobium sp. STM 3809]CCE02829.1 hypothetical protein BRAS3809_6630003 [Bradyrhizobium sp. STM 3809]
MKLTQLLYVSRLSNAAIDPDFIAKILVVARDHNDRAGITGLLVFNGTYFMQLLEGQRSRLNGLFMRIARVLGIADSSSSTSMTSTVGAVPTGRWVIWASTVGCDELHLLPISELSSIPMRPAARR